MSIPPATESPEWDNYPVDTTPLPEPTAPTPQRGILPMVMAGAMVGMLIIAAVLAMTYSGDDDDLSTNTDQLPFTASAAEDADTPTEPASEDAPDETVADEPSSTISAAAPGTTAVDGESAEVRWPDDYGWEESSEPYWSGCTSGTDDGLPDGVWFGYVTDVRPANVEFDLACHYGIGRDFVSDDPDETDYLDIALIENDSTATRTIVMSASLEVYTFSNDTGPVGPISGFDYLETGRLDGLADAVITVENGFVTEIRHQPAAG